MKLSYNWLNQLLPQPLSLDELTHILTAIGLEVDSVEEYSTIKGALAGLVIGKIITANKHDNADKLQVCTVDVGEAAPKQIVCGAPNAAAGQTVVVALPGTTIYPSTGEPFTIKQAKIRGVESSGMICAEDEIGLGASHAGIIVIDADVAPGTLASTYYNIPKADYTIEIGLTPNRMDAMSHMGVAKDVCAYLSNLHSKPYQVVLPSFTLPTALNSSNMAIQILANDACKRYAGISISNITVQDSPEWLQHKLLAIGCRPINNIVDITNYVLHETGQPLHAFDAAAIEGQTIQVQYALADQAFTTLDDKERKLQATDLMICNATSPMCIAGVFGGSNSGVSASTTAIFLESAWFAPSVTRKTSIHHNLRTDAAIRFEKGVDISKTVYALERAAALMVEIAGATISSNIIDVYPTPFEKNTITTTYQYINTLSGGNYSVEKIINILTHLGFEILKNDGTQLEVSVPFAKPDITIPADLVEEIMRIDGLDNIPFTGKINFALANNTIPANISVKAKVKNILLGMGFFEMFTNSITNSAYYPEHTSLVKMMNRLSAELDCMRPTMLHTGLQSIAHNINRKNSDIRFFEIGKIYNQYNGAFVEQEQIAMYITGNIQTEHWQSKSQAATIYNLKGAVQALLQSFGITPTFTEDKAVISIKNKKQQLGFIQAVDAETLQKMDIKQAVFFAQINVSAIADEVSKSNTRFVGIPKFPSVRRDVALVIDKATQYQALEKAVQKANASLLQSMNVFDVFEHEKLGADKKSYAISLVFGNSERTLTDAEVEADVQKIVQSLEKEVNASIR